MSFRSNITKSWIVLLFDFYINQGVFIACPKFLLKIIREISPDKVQTTPCLNSFNLAQLFFVEIFVFKMRSSFDLQAWYQNLFFFSKNQYKICLHWTVLKKKSTHEWTNTILWFLQHFFKNLCKHLTQKVFQKNPCPDLITKSFIEKQTCLSKKNHPA